MLNYSKGKWRVSSKGIGIVDESEFPIAICYPDSRIKGPESLIQMRANANLISQAPRMYEAIKAFIENDGADNFRAMEQAIALVEGGK